MRLGIVIFILGLLVSLMVVSSQVQVEFVGDDFYINNLKIIVDGYEIPVKPVFYDKFYVLGRVFLSWYPSDSSGSGVKSIVTSTSTLYAVMSSYQRKAFYANGRFWVFYYDGSNIVYRSSVDGSSWSDAVVIANAGFFGRGDVFSLWFDGIYLHYARSYNDYGNDVYRIYYRCGVPNSNGTITWNMDEQVAVESSSAVYSPFIAVDSEGYPWIGYQCNKHPWVTKSSLNNGSWVTASGFPYELSTTDLSSQKPSIIPLTNGKVAVIYEGGDEKIKVRAWTGAQWKSEVSGINTLYDGEKYSAVAVGDTVHIVYISEVGYYLYYTKYTYSTNALSTETRLFTESISQAPVICADEDSGDLYVFFEDDDVIYYVKYTASSSSWGNKVSWIDETSETVQGSYVTCFYQAYNGKIGLIYTAGSSNPYKIKLATMEKGLSQFKVTCDFNIQGKYVRASKSSPWNTVNYTLSIYHNVDSTNNWNHAESYPYSNASLPVSVTDWTSNWIPLLSGSYSEGLHTYYIKVELTVQSFDLNETLITRTAYTILEMDLTWTNTLNPAYTLKIVECYNLTPKNTLTPETINSAIMVIFTSILLAILTRRE